jgi:hypothetical protein
MYYLIKTLIIFVETVHGMAKEHYNVSFKTYFNERIKPTVFRGKESYPLYVQVIFDRKSLFFKSYYFKLFSHPKYDFLGTTFSQIDKLESRVIDFFIDMYSERFELDIIRRNYGLTCLDVLDFVEGAFKKWLISYLKEEGFPGLSALVEHAVHQVCAIHLWDDLRKIMDPEIFKEMEKVAMLAGAYLPLAMYVRHVSPEGPFCLPVYEWSNKKKRIAIEDFIEEKCWVVDSELILRQTPGLILFPMGKSEGTMLAKEAR